jgi:Abnormal spindle-like microcephaly-assoc'd, ASPM-SPD-2-Hydin/PQQ-like domain
MRKLAGLASVVLFPLAAATSANAATTSPGSLSWAAVAIGSKGGQKVATLTNSSAAAISINGISISGGNLADFTVFSKTCGATLAAGASCTANIVFGPTGTGTRTAILNFNDSDSNSPQTVALSGLGTSGVVAASPSSLAFASTAVGSGSASQAVTLSNGNTSPITISSVAVTGANASDFVVSGTTCGASLSVNASCTATLVFKPTAAGTRTATLTFTDSAASSPQTVALSGVGGVTPATASVSPASLSFPGASIGSTSAPQTVTLSNGPGAPLTISSIAVTGANASDFVLSGTTCGASMAVSATCTATIVFHPSATGARAATLSFVDSATNSPQVVALSGSGASTGATAASPSGLSWAAVAVGTKSGQKVVTLTNANAAPITFNSISFSGANPTDFMIYSKTCGATLAAGASCTANVVFGPTATGTRTAILNFNDSDTTSPQTITLSGLGTSGVVAASPSTVAFGNTALGTTTAAHSVTLSNGNTSPITISSIGVTGANASDFLLAGTTCGSSLSVGASCSANLAFKPGAAGVRSAALSFTDSAVSSPQTVALSGFGGTLLTIAPLTPTVAVNGTLHFTSSVASTWTASCGSIGSDGTFTAPASAGSCTVTATATDGSGQTASTSVTMVASVTITPNSVRLHALNVQTFTANQPVTWSASCGSISSGGVFTAPGSAATCAIMASASNGISQSATVTANVDVANYTAWKGGGGLLGAQTNELSLTPSNVNATSFGLQWTAPVDGWVNAQPLYMNGQMVNGAPHNVVFFVTANDSVYAFDADTGIQLWQVSLIPPGATAVTGTAAGLVSAPLIGILGTPVIDPATNTMYLVAETLEQNATSFPHRLHALDLATGSEKFGGPVLVNDSQMAPVHKLQRTGMTLANGNVYFGIGSVQDIQTYHGLVFAFNAQTLAQQAVWVSTPTGSDGGVWMGGAAPSVDADGNIYLTTGDGTMDGSANFGEAVVKLSPELQVLDYFAPYNYATYNAANADLGSGDVIVVPDQAGSHPHELIACGKPTPIYVLDRDNLGQVGTTSDNIIQPLDNQLGTYSNATHSVQACFTGPAMWGQNVYFGGKYDVLKMFTLDPNTGLLSSAPVSQGTLTFGYPGADPVVSANGATNGIVWSIDTKTNSLIANDATNLANTLFTGALSAPAIRWTVPTVVNGHVYVGEQGKVFGFGLK